MPAVAGGGLEGIVPGVTVSELGNLWAPNGVTLEAMSNEGLT